MKKRSSAPSRQLLVALLEARTQGEPPHRDNRGDGADYADAGLDALALVVLAHASIVTSKTPGTKAPGVSRHQDRLALLGSLYRELQDDLVADDQAAVLEASLEVDAEFTTIHLGASLEARDRHARSHARALA